MLTENQLTTLRAVCDTVVPAISREDDEHGVWARSATDLGADQAVAQAIESMAPEASAGIGQLLDLLESQKFAELSQASREQTFTPQPRQMWSPCACVTNARSTGFQGSM